ncbi:MAG: NAD(P)H-hydrate dehydratase [Gammaproteobacteria bacterium]|nr:NAD(P)H-hydrate dehydratase [Gammaproteobacteria bacterium]
MATLERVYTGTECREIDRVAIEEYGIESFRLMHRAAHFAKIELLNRWSNPNSVTIVCGAGNNAGDGYLLAEGLHARGVAVQIMQIGALDRLQGDAQRAFKAIEKLDLEFSSNSGMHGEIIVDALLGTGVRGAIRPNFVDAIDRINASSRPILALDLPSGIDADTGGFLTAEPVRATLTTCFVGRKFALVTGSARNVAGEVASSDLDIPEQAFECVAGTRVIPTSADECRLPSRPPNSHKGHFGHVLIVGGNRGMGGAALLAGEACLRTGAGLVSVVTHSDHAPALLAARPELMIRGSADGLVDESLLNRADVIAVGPGLGRDAWAQQALKSVVAKQMPLVVDADALHWLADSKHQLPKNSIVTPHPGEAAHLLNVATSSIENDRASAIKNITQQFACVGVLKGAGSLIANHGELYGVCDIAEPTLSTAGSGDVLTGVIAACLAQLKKSLTATALGVHLHATAGCRARETGGGRGVIAGDFISALRPWGENLDALH